MAGQVKPIPVPVILAAVSGDENALAAVVAHYQKYIRALATRPVKDEYGNEYLYVDEDILMSILLSIAVLKGRCIMTCEKKVQVKDKFCLTIDEAAEYFNIGEKKLRKIVADHLDSDFVIQNGVKVLIKRKRFEGFLEDLTAL